MPALLCRLSLALLVLPLSLPLAAHMIDGDTSGNWFALDQPCHGLQIEILESSQAVIAWYTYDIDGEALWLFGQGLVQGERFSAALDARRGTAFPPAFDPAEIEVERWGQVQFEQLDCEHARLDYWPEDPAYAAGSLMLTRLTRIDSLGCRPAEDYAWTWRFGFDQGLNGFEALFLDYPDGEEEFFELDWGHAALPGAWSARHGIRISGANRSDDLLMMLKRRIDGLEPDRRYRLELGMQYASDVPTGCVGIGGSPGESVYMKVGASGLQPAALLEDSGLPDVPPMRRANIDLGQQSQAGEYSVVVGNMANGVSDLLCGEDQRPWLLLRRSSADQAYEVTSNAQGQIWVYAFSDSGFEGASTWYLSEFSLRLSAL